MKTLKTVLSVFVVVMLLTTTVVFADALSKDTISPYDKAASHSSEMYQSLLKSFAPNGTPEENDYPEYYGGAYVNDDGRLVIYITDGYFTDEIQNTVMKTVDSRDVLFVSAKYSFKHLTETMNEINDYAINHPKDFEPKAWMILDDKNYIQVVVNKIDKETPSIISDAGIKDDCVKYIAIPGEPENDVNVNPGNKVTCPAGGLSMGYRVKKGGVAGVVTAAHAPVLNDNISFSGTVFAKVTARQNSGSVDVSFCEITNSSYTPTNAIGSATLSTALLDPAAGQNVTLIGAVSGTQSGAVLSTNASHTVDGVTLTNVTSAQYTRAHGDSGGLIYLHDSAAGKYYTVGIHRGNHEGYAFFCKASKIATALSVSRY
jgi:streptogrisin B